MTEPLTGSDETLEILVSSPLDDPTETGEALSPAAWCILASISDRLFDLNDRGSPEPNLVSSSTVSGNGTTWRFQIHSGRRFHSGEEVTADDVLYSLLEAAPARPEGRRLADLADLEEAGTRLTGRGVHRISRYRFEIQLRDRCEGLLSYLALPVNGIKRRGSAAGSIDCCSGPYRVESRGAVEWSLRIDRNHPAAHPKSFERVLVRSVDPTIAIPGRPSPVAASCAALLDDPFDLAARLPVGWRERMVRLPGERFFYLRLRPGVAAAEGWIRVLRSVLESPALARAFYGLKPPTFLPGIAPATHDRSGALRPHAPEGIVAIGADGPRPAFLEAIARECAARGAPVRFVPEKECGSTEPCHAWLRSMFVGHSLDELGFLRRLCAEEPRLRSPGKGFLLSLGAAGRAVQTAARNDGLRALVRDLGPELGVVPLFQVAAGLLVDPRIDREALNAAGGFTSLSSLCRRSARFDHAELNQAMLTALGSATQMFAHDVRRPFSMVRILLDMIRSAGSLAEVKETAARMMPDVEQALGAVNGMIQDILEIGTAREPVREVVLPDHALLAALREVFETRAGADIRFAYDLRHTRPFHASLHQVHRVLANILANAAEAMQNRGEIRLATEDVLAGGRPFVLVSIANTGSLIPPEDLPRIFDAFFSKGKRGGTGLGLAISRKIIEAHEGRIWCSSDEHQGVRFSFTLPANESEARPPQHLPAHSRQIVEEYHERTALSLSEDERRAVERERVLAGNLAAFRESNRRRLRVWVVDDEAVYAQGILALIRDASWFEENVELSSLRDEAETLAALAEGPPDMVICDIDLGAASGDGFEVSRRLRERGVGGVICIHSHRSVPADFRAAIEAGADAFLPKPMSRPHLLRLLDESAREGAGLPANPMEAPVEAAESAALSRVPTLVVIDDEIFMRRAWTRRVDDARVLTFRSPAEFRERRGSASPRWEDIDCIVTDFHFGNAETEQADVFIRRLRSEGYSGPVVLSSNTTEGESVADLVDARIDKRPIPWREIRRILEECDDGLDSGTT